MYVRHGSVPLHRATPIYNAAYITTRTHQHYFIDVGAASSVFVDEQLVRSVRSRDEIVHVVPVEFMVSFAVRHLLPIFNARSQVGVFELKKDPSFATDMIVRSG